LVAPAVAFGAPSFAAAQLVACVFGGLAVAPAALAAERLQRGAGVAAGALLMVAAGSVVAAGAGAATGVSMFVVACALWAFTAGRRALAFVLAVVAAAGTGAAAGTALSAFVELRLGLGAAVVLLPFVRWRALGARGLVLGVAFVVAVVLAAVLDAWRSLLPTWSPLLAVLAGAGCARFGKRFCDVLLAIVVAVDCHAAWMHVEPPEAAAERLVGRYLARQFAPEDTVVSDSPRVLWAAGRRPDPAPDADALLVRAGVAGVASIVLASDLAGDATLRASLAARFVRAELPHDLGDLAEERGLVVLLRR
jgi:hypothetical protein